MKKLISWVDIPTENFERGVNFYNAVLKLQLQPVDCGTEKMACFPNGEGSIAWAPDFKPSGNGVLVSFAVPDSIEETIKRIEKNKGKVTIPKTKIEVEGMGYFAVFIDSEGNKAGLYEEL
jgi:uncharacterized protein